MTETILPGLHLVGSNAMTDPRDCEVYLVDIGEGQGLLVDAGANPDASGIIRSVEGLGLRVSHLVLTHAHIDHIGGAVAIWKRFGCSVIAHKEDLLGIQAYDPVRTAADYYGIRYEPVQVDSVLEGDQTLELGNTKFSFHHIPGHTPGSIALSYQSKEGMVLFCQDIHGPFDPNWGSDTFLWRESVHKLIELEPDVLCEGHFGVYRPAGKARDYLESFVRRMA